ncbi:MAG: hypothetical protein AB1640_15440 [bacterium]
MHDNVRPPCPCETGQRQTHCPRLGGPVPFRYCLKPAQPQACFKILDCWWQIFDVVTYLREHLEPPELEALMQHRRSPPDRLQSILAAVQGLPKKGSAV